MNTDIIAEMIEAGCIDHGHFDLAHVHTDNLVKEGFVYSFNIADKINMALFNVIKDIQYKNIVALDPTATLISYPLSLMCRRTFYSPGNIEHSVIEDDSIVVLSIIKSIDDINNIFSTVTGPIKAIVCVANYSGIAFINGINIINVVPINTWKAEDCPYCKDTPNE